MGTRGAWGFRKDNVDKITYNHCDSYPSGLGKTIKEFICNHLIEELEKTADRIVLIDGKTSPIEKQIKECSKFIDLDVSTKSKYDWYCLLRETQGNPEAYVKDIRYMIDNSKFIKDSLFCEYAYVINLDTKKLEIYVGCQKHPQKNRYFKKPTKDDEYANCKLEKEVPLIEVKEFDMESIK